MSLLHSTLHASQITLHLHNPHCTSCQQNVQIGAIYSWIRNKQCVGTYFTSRRAREVIKERKSIRIKFPAQPAQPYHWRCAKGPSWLGRAWWSAIKCPDLTRLPQKVRKGCQRLRNNDPFCIISRSGWFVPYEEKSRIRETLNLLTDADHKTPQPPTLFFYWLTWEFFCWPPNPPFLF